MKSKVWNKIFHKNRSSSTSTTTTNNTTISPVKESSIPITSSVHYDTNNSLPTTSSLSVDNLNEEFMNSCNNYDNKYSKDNIENYEYKKKSIIQPGTSATLGRLNFLQQQQQQEIMTNNNNNNNNNSKTSKISKMVNSFSLKRNTKKNKTLLDSCNPDVAISIIKNNESTNLFNFEQQQQQQFNNKISSSSLKTKSNTNFTTLKSTIDFNKEFNIPSTDYWQFDIKSPTTTTTFKPADNKNMVNSIGRNNNIEELLLSSKSDYIKPLDNFTYQSEPIVMELKPCSICNRNFNPDSLEKHIKVCEKWATKKRKPFDSSRQRREGTELAAFLPKNFGLPGNKNDGSSTADSKTETRIEEKSLKPQKQPQQQQQQQQQPNNLPKKQQKSVPGTSGINNGGASSAPKKSLTTNSSPTPRTNSTQMADIKARAEAKRHVAPSSEQCPECGRNFGIKAFDRHVEFCKEKSRITQFKGNNSTQAKERLEARTKYKAPNLKLKRAAVRDKYSVNGDEGHEENRMDDFLSMSNSLSSSFMSDGGFSDKYDPFLSAKRQLEELCSPTSTAQTNFDEIKSPKTPLTPKTPIYSNFKTSPHNVLNSSISSSMSASYTGPSTSTPINPTKTLNAVKSNFRRTSSLRAPRKTNPSRPLFVPPSRSKPSTIQRGISDEGPISTNFIKPEEYDEMPVKSACINNFATSINSPRLKRDPSPRPRILSSSSRESSPKIFIRDPSPLVVRRNSNTNRRNLRLNLNNGDENLPTGVQKTDSLAVFLKYENELVKGLVDAPSAIIQETDRETSSPDIIQRTNPIPPPPLVSEKDLKDKTNILSKQNSIKNSSSDLQVDKSLNYNYLSNEKDLKLSALKTNTNISEQHTNGWNKNAFGSRPRTAETYLSVNKILPVKLEPLPKSVVIRNSISNVSTPLKTSTPVSTPYINTLAPLFPSIKPIHKTILESNVTVGNNSNNVNLTSIFFNSNNNSKDHNNYIDPKLINPCDNLKIHVTPDRDSSDDVKSNWSQDSNDTAKISSNKSNSKSNFIPKDDDNHNIDLDSFASQIKRSQQDQYQDQLSTCSRNSTTSEKSNKLFKRQIRLGKNQFLYDASPSDSESSPDLIEIDRNSDHDNPLNSNRKENSNNKLSKSSVKQTSTTSTTITTNLSQNINCEKEFDSLLSPSVNPIFDNFDFEEFLASFENNNDNDDLFPGLKDCKEFLMNRCLNMRSNNNFNNKNLPSFHQYHNNTPCDSVRSQKIEAEQNLENRKRSQNEDEKHEIFISIETDQNDNDETLDVDSCTADPSIMKNPEVEEINGNDNKFTKIETYHLPIFEEDKDNTLSDFEVKSIPRGRLVKRLIREENKNNDDNRKDDGDYENIMEKAIESTNSDLYPADSDDVSSVECYPVGRKSVKSKASSDSAYGSLSRNSPTSITDRSNIHHRTSTKGHNHLPSTSNSVSQGENDLKIKNSRSNGLNASSSSSENSLLPNINHNYIQQQPQQQQHQQQLQQQHQQQQQQQLQQQQHYQHQNSLPSNNGSIEHFLNQNFNVKSDSSDYNIRKDLISNKNTSNDSISNCSSTNKPMLSKFCYECGSKFLVQTAKFCMECGVKRLAIE